MAKKIKLGTAASSSVSGVTNIDNMLMSYVPVPRIDKKGTQVISDYSSFVLWKSQFKSKFGDVNFQNINGYWEVVADGNATDYFNTVGL